MTSLIGKGSFGWAGEELTCGIEYMFFLFNDLLLYASFRKKFPTSIGKMASRAPFEYQGFFLLFDAVVIDLPDQEGMLQVE